jgi:hypothetical protein
MKDVLLKGVTFQINDQDTGTASFILSVRKSGSTMFNQVCKRLATHNQANFVDVPAGMFRSNMPASAWIRDPELNSLIYPGNTYGGFRNFPLALADNKHFRAARKILLVRDPRDALVSEFFSNAYSHKIPPGQGGARERLLQQRRQAREQGVESYVLERVPLMQRTLGEYIPFLDDPNLLLLKYEDIIFDKSKMIDDVCAHLGWTCKPPFKDATIEAVDIRPEKEQQTEFIRKVTPGDHLEKLSSSAIDTINGQMREILDAYRYPVRAHA